MQFIPIKANYIHARLLRKGANQNLFIYQLLDLVTSVKHTHLSGKIQNNMNVTYSVSPIQIEFSYTYD